MSLKKILMKGTTRMSLHERFTFLRNQSAAEPTTSIHVAPVRQGLFSDQQASLKNRRLLQMMDRQNTVMTALKLKKRILKQRLGQTQGRLGLSVKDRLSLRGRGGLRGRVGPRNATGRSPLVRLGSTRGIRRGRGNLGRSQSMTNLTRSQSMQSLSGRRNNSVGMRGGGGQRFQNRTPYRQQEYSRGGGRGRGLRSRGGFNRNRDDFRSQRGGRFNTRNQRSRGFRGRGGGRGGRGRGGRGPPPTREELDSQLDQYMASSRGVLDRDLDTYMSGNQQEESWD